MMGVSSREKRDPAGQQNAADASSDSGSVQLNNDLKRMSYEEQVAAIQPDRPIQLQRAEHPVQKDEESGGGEAKSNTDKYKDAAKKVAEAWLETETGKKLKEKAKEFAFSKKGLPLTVIVGTQALAAMIANEMDLPIGSLSVDVTLGTIGDKEFTLQLKPIWEGPINDPSEYGGMVTLTISDFIKRDTGPEPGSPAKERAKFVFQGQLEKPDGKAPDCNDLVVLVNANNQAVRKDMTHPGSGKYKLEWWAKPWAEGRDYKLMVIPGAGGPTSYKKVTIPINLNDYYIAARFPQTITNIIRLEEIGGGKQTMYFDFPPG